jgi:capsular exopolysaccharide synthesis family protein
MNELTFPDKGLRPLAIGPNVATRQDLDMEGEQSVFTRYLHVLLRRKWFVVGAVAVAVIVGLMITLMTTPVYTASTRLEINRVGAQVVDVRDVEPETGVGDPEFYQTQYGILQSRALAERVARELKLADNREFFEHFGATELSEQLASGPSAAMVQGREARLRAAVDILLKNLDITPIRLSKLVDIHFTSPDPGLSARVADAWANSFIQHNLARRSEATAFARRFLEERLGQMQQRLEESERQLVNYASNQAIINIPIGDSGGNGDNAPQERSLAADSLVALNQELAKASADRVEAQSQLARSTSAASGEALGNPTITGLRGRRAEAAAEYQRLMVQFEPSYPSARALAAQIQQLDQSISREEARVGSSLSNTLRNTYQASVRREQQLAQQLGQLKQTFIDERRRGIQYNIFKRDVDNTRELYDSLLQRYKEIGVAGDIAENNVLIVDTAEVPAGPSQPRPLLNLLLAALIGLLAGVALAFLREQMDETINEPSELDRRIGLPALGVIPKSALDNPLEDLRDPKSDLVEAGLSIITTLGFATDHGVPTVLAVTSTRPAEGKSTTSQALAHMLARQGSRTLLVDGDMRSPSLHGRLGLTNTRGLSTYLSGADELDQLVQQPSDQPFMVMTAGPQPPNAAELLRTDRLPALLAELAKRFEHVVIDCPPVLGLADAPVLAAQAEGTVFVVEAHRVRARLIRQSLNRLVQGRARVVGAVLSKFEPKSAGYGYGYGHSYGYGYGRDKAASK